MTGPPRSVHRRAVTLRPRAPPAPPVGVAGDAVGSPGDLLQVNGARANRRARARWPGSIVLEHPEAAVALVSVDLDGQAQAPGRRSPAAAAARRPRARTGRRARGAPRTRQSRIIRASRRDRARASARHPYDVSRISRSDATSRPAPRPPDDRGCVCTPSMVTSLRPTMESRASSTSSPTHDRPEVDQGAVRLGDRNVVPTNDLIGGQIDASMQRPSPGQMAPDEHCGSGRPRHRRSARRAGRRPQ